MLQEHSRITFYYTMHGKTVYHVRQCRAIMQQRSARKMSHVILAQVDMRNAEKEGTEPMHKSVDSGPARSGFLINAFNFRLCLETPCLVRIFLADMPHACY